MDSFVSLTWEIKGATCFQNAHCLRFNIPITCLFAMSTDGVKPQGQPGLTVNFTECCGVCDAPVNMESTSS